MSPWNLTPATPQDVGIIAELVLGCAPSCLPIGEAEVRRRIDEFHVLRDEQNAVVGCAALRTLPDRRLEIGSVAVSKEHRGEGLGRRLVEGVLEAAQRRRRPVVCVTRCPGFFARLGFRPLGADPVLDKPGVPAAPELPPRVAMGLRGLGDVSRMAA